MHARHYLDLAARRGVAVVIAGLILAPVVVLAAVALKLATLGPSGVPPHIVCWREAPALVELHLAGDVATWLAYTVIPGIASYLLAVGKVGRARLAFAPLLAVGALFVLFCGLGHMLDSVETWLSIQWFRGWWKVATGAVSWVFVIQLLYYRRPLAAMARALARAEHDGSP